jgi:hypothetical protein
MPQQELIQPRSQLAKIRCGNVRYAAIRHQIKRLAVVIRGAAIFLMPIRGERTANCHGPQYTCSIQVRGL